MGIDVRILGPLEVERDGEAVHIAPGRDRRLLGLLVTRVGEAVPTERLIGELWSERPPRTAAAALHNSVSRVRKALGTDVLQTRAHGYALELERDRVDAARFERLVRESSAAPPAAAADLLRTALALWRGRALVDFTYEPFAQGEIARLEDLRLTALELRIDADLALGREHALAGELRGLVVEHPFRERLWRQLMLALYAAGLQADALAAYQDARRTFVEQLGVEPSPLLRDLENAILRHELPRPERRPLELRAEPAAPQPRAPAPVERRQVVTVLFVDLVDSTRLGAALDPEALRGVLSRYFTVVGAEVERVGGVVEKFIGDAMLGVFGIPRAHEDDALRAAHAAWAAKGAIERLNEDLRRDWGVELTPRLGANTGEVITGGADAPVTGQAISVAKRLEEAAMPGELLVGETTWRLIRDVVDAEPRPFTARGAEPGATAWRVTAVRDAKPFTRRLETPIVGRGSELERLRQALQHAASVPTAHLFTLLGPPGIGKTRLSIEFAGEVDGRCGVVSASCPAFGDARTYRPLRQLVDQCPPSSERARVERLVGDDATRPEDLAFAVRALVEALAVDKPLVVVLEDVHWAHGTFLDLVEYLAASIRDAPVLLLCVARLDLLDERPGWGGGKLNATSLLLEPLTAEECERMIELVAGDRHLPAGAGATVVETAEGNPLFLEQLVTAVLLGEGDAVPPTLQALLAARLDRLGPGERAVAEAAAVAGREFSPAAVADVDRDVAGSVEQHVRSLVHREVVRPLRTPAGGEPAFSFRHALMREVAYRLTAKARRADLHVRLARRIERRAANADELIGFHLEQAAALRRELAPVTEETLRLEAEAGARLGRAGIRAWKGADIPAARELLARAAALLPAEDPERVEVLTELGLAVAAGGDLRGGESAIREAVETAAVRGDLRRELRARLDLAGLQLFTEPEGKSELVLELAERATPVFEQASDDRSLARAWQAVAFVHGAFRCDNSKWEAASQRALLYYRRSGWSPSIVWAGRSAALYHGPTPVDVALARCRRMLAEADLAGQTLINVMIACLEAMRGEFPKARRLVAAAEATYADLGQTVAIARDCGWAKGEVERLAGDYAAAEAALRDSCEWLERIGETAGLSTRAAELAEALYAQGRYDDAEAWTRTAERSAALDDVGAQFSWRAVRAKVVARRGELGKALTHAREAVARVERTDALNQHAEILLALAEVLRLDGRPSEAAAATEEALTLFERKGNNPAVARTKKALSELAPV